MYQDVLLFLVQGTAIVTFLLFMLLIFAPRISKGNTLRTYFFKDAESAGETFVFTLFYIVLFGTLFVLNTAYSPEPIYSLGALLALAGLLIAFAARMQLRLFWSPVTNTQHSLKILDTGLFNIVRHPIYVGRVYFFLGVMLMFNVLWAILVIPYWYLLRKKAMHEEKYLLKTNKRYAAYYARVPRGL